MNRFINKILSEAEDSSDDFFQSKHVNKRNEDIKKKLDDKRSKGPYILTSGLERIKIAYKNEDWKDDKEKLFLELFSELRVRKRLFKNKYYYGFCLLDANNNITCIYDIKLDAFRIDHRSIWNEFYFIFDMKDDDIQTFINDMLKKYFKLHDVLSSTQV